MANETKKNGAHGWPLAPSKHFPGESTLACPTCDSTDVTMGVSYGPGRRLGDPGAMSWIQCNDCTRKDWKAAKPMQVGF